MHTYEYSAMNELNAIAAIATRDFFKFLCDRSRVVLSLLIPFLLLFLLGGTLQANLGQTAGFNFVDFTFTGVLGLTVFQSTARASPPCSTIARTTLPRRSL